MASEEPQMYTYSFETKTSSTPPGNNAAYITSKEKREDPAFRWHYSGKQHRGMPIWQRATDRRQNPVYTAYNKARTNAINTELTAMTTKTFGQVNMSGEPRGNYAAALLGKKKPGTNVNNVNELAGLMDKVTMGGKRNKKRSTKKRHTKKRSTRRHRKSLKKTIHRRR
jgi:hypothetical protein